MNVCKWLLGCGVVLALSMGPVGCGGSDDNDADGTGGGGGSGDLYLTCKINGQAFSISGLQLVQAKYHQRENETIVYGIDSDYYFTFVIPGHATGSMSLPTYYLSLSVLENSQSVYDASNDTDELGASLHVELTTYGSVGGYITGTFSGTVVNVLTGHALVITEGQFRASRTSDIGA